MHKCWDESTAHIDHSLKINMYQYYITTTPVLLVMIPVVSKRIISGD